MRQEQGFNALEAQIHMTMDRFSNGEPVYVDDKWIEEAAEAFKASLRRQLQPPAELRQFGLRMSNFGRPTCQLQQEQLGTPKGRRDTGHILKMMIGDMVEIATVIILKAAQVPITNSKQKHRILVDGVEIPGEDDIEISGKVYDIKSSSDYMYNHKWADGWNGVYYSDSFGYVGQLYGYAEKDPDKMGGWIVVNKSNGDLRVVPAEPTIDQLEELDKKVVSTVSTINGSLPFERGFQPEAETFYKKETGNTLVPRVCTFCDYMNACWPDAMLKAKAMSKSANPTSVWYVEYNTEEN